MRLRAAALLIFLSVIVLSHAYVGWRLLPWLPPVLAGLGALWLLLSGVAMALLPRLRQARHPLLTWLPAVAMGVFSWLFVLTLLRDLGLGLWGLLGGAAWDGLTAGTAQFTAAAALLASGLGLYFARRTAAVRTVEVALPGLPAALDGFSIVQLSDIHVGPTIKKDYLQAIVARVNTLDADVVAITGDLVDGSVEDLAEHTAPLAQLQARHGRFFVTGNHEYYSGALAWISELRRLGLTVLLNEHVALQHNGHTLTLAGVTDYSAHLFHAEHRSDPHAAIAGAPAGPKILLAHQPRTAAAAAAAGFHLQLSGHTHGGQFWPWNHFVPLQQPFVAGLARWQALWVYTSRGTGYWGPPLRFGAPSEITRLRLRPA